MYFQLEVYYYSNANKKKYTHFQLKASIRNNLKITGDEIVQDIVFATRTCHTLLLGLVVTWKYIFQVQVMFLWPRHKSLYIHINMIYVNKNQQGHS